MRPYYVVAWHTRTFEQPYVRVQRGQPGRSTRPQITTWINTAITSAEVLDNHLSVSPSGFLAECEMLIQEKIDGYFDGRSGDYHSYRELQQSNPNMRSRSRYFRTTGVVLCIEEDWFKSLPVKKAFSDRLREVFAHEFSFSSRDIGSAASNIAVLDGNGSKRRSGLVAVFDETYGSLRFTESLYLNFDRILDRLMKAAETDSPQDSINLSEIIEKVRETTSEFTLSSPISADIANAPTGYEPVFTPDSVVCYRESGSISEDVEIIQPTIMKGDLMYQVKTITPPGQSAVIRWIDASLLEPSADADAYDYAWWNRETQTYEEPPEDETSAI